MKFQNTAAFDKHLKEAFAEHFSPAYMIMSGEEGIRKKLINRLVSIFQKKDPNAQRIDVSLSTVFDSLNTRPLIGSFSIVVLDDIHLLKKGETQRLESYLKNPASYAYLILGSSSSKGLFDLCKKVVVLDLTEEKPWERQARLKEWLLAVASKEKKRLTPELIEFLLAHKGGDISLLEQELNKLITYCLDKEVIELKDAERVCSNSLQITSWKQAENLIKEGKFKGESPVTDTSSLLAFMGQLRYQLEKQGGRRAALNELFKLEMKLKTTSIDPLLLFDLFRAKL